MAGGIQHGVLLGKQWVYSISGVEVKSYALLGAGRGTCWGKSSEEREKQSLPPSLSVSLPHSAVASQLVLRGTWRHLVSVSIGGVTTVGCCWVRSAPAAGEEAADARLQGVTGAAASERGSWQKCFL